MAPNYIVLSFALSLNGKHNDDFLNINLEAVASIGAILYSFTFAFCSK